MVIECFVRHTAATRSRNLCSSTKQPLNSSRTGQCRVNLGYKNAVATAGHESRLLMGFSLDLKEIT